MALDHRNRLAVFRTVQESFAVTWALKIPYLVIVLLVATPWAVAADFGLLDSVVEYASRGAAADAGNALGAFPLSTLLVIWAGSFIMMVIFGIFWQRYVLLGREGESNLGLALLSAVLMSGSGIGLTIAVGLVALVLALVLVVVVGSLLGSLLTDAAGPIVFLVAPPLTIVAYAVPLTLLAQLSLVFPIIAVGERTQFDVSWRRAMSAGWRLFAALLLAGIPAALFAFAMQTLVFHAAFGADVMDPRFAGAATYSWWISFALSPLICLPIALCYSIVAIAFRNLAGSAEPMWGTPAPRPTA